MLFATSDRSFGINITSSCDTYDARFFVMEVVFPEGSLGSGLPEMVSPDIAQLNDLPVSTDASLDPAAASPTQLLEQLRKIDRTTDRLRVEFGETLDFEMLRAYRHNDNVVFLYEVANEVHIQVVSGCHFDEVVAAVRQFVDGTVGEQR